MKTTTLGRSGLEVSRIAFGTWQRGNGLTVSPVWWPGMTWRSSTPRCRALRRPRMEGQLVILASGAAAVRPQVEPIFDVLGHQTLWLQSTGDGSRLKLALNNWLAVLVEGMVETLTLSEALGLDPHLLLEAVADGPMGSDYALAKGAAMLNGRVRPRLPVATRDQGRRARTERRAPARCGTSADERSTTALVPGHRRRPWRR